MTKATTGNYFEDFSVGMRLRHPTPRTVSAGDLALYIALTGDRRALHASAEYARGCGFRDVVAHDLLTFHIVFGKTVGQVSLNAVANLGYADVRFLRPVYCGDTLLAETEVIGLRETSSRKTGIVYVSTRGVNQRGEEVLRFIRWVLVNKRDPSAEVGDPCVPELPESVAAADLIVAQGLNAARLVDQRWATGGRALWADYEAGERIHHIDGMTLEEAEHTMATRLYQNTARVHFNQHQMERSRFGKRLVYGGHVISVAHALAHNGFENAFAMAAWNGGTHANPAFAGDTIYAWTDVLAREELPGRDDVGALRLRLVGVKNADPSVESISLKVTTESGKEQYDPRVVLDLDYWALIPR